MDEGDWSGPSCIADPITDMFDPRIISAPGRDASRTRQARRMRVRQFTEGAFDDCESGYLDGPYVESDCADVLTRPPLLAGMKLREWVAKTTQGWE